MRSLLKQLAAILALIVVLPLVVFCWFGRIRSMFSLGAQLLALAPGKPGSFLRAAYYRCTLQSCHWDVHVEMGSFFAHREAILARRVSIGPYCVLGKTSIGARTMLAASVQILSGAQQHIRDSQGRLQDGVYKQINIGEDVWIGAAAIILADVGDRSTVAAGAVVVHPVPADCIVAGNPARILSPKPVS